MRSVIQRVKASSVKVSGATIGQIHEGLLVLLGVAQSDTYGDADFLAEKIINLRIFEDHKGKMNHSLMDTGGEMLVVSQFTLQGDCRKGRRPSFTNAADPQNAKALYERFTESVRQSGVNVKSGLFGAHMQESLINDGPVTFIIESKK